MFNWNKKSLYTENQNKGEILKACCSEQNTEEWEGGRGGGLDCQIVLCIMKMKDCGGTVQVNRLPVCRNGRVVGILTRGDMLQCLLWEMLMAGSSGEAD